MEACEYCGGAILQEACMMCGRRPSTVYWVTAGVEGGGWRRRDAHKHLVDKEKTGNRSVCGSVLVREAVGRLDELPPCQMCQTILTRRVRALAAMAKKAVTA